MAFWATLVKIAPHQTSGAALGRLQAMDSVGRFVAAARNAKLVGMHMARELPTMS